MEWVLIVGGIAVFVLLGWTLHLKFATNPPQVHSNAKPQETHDPKEAAKATFIGIPPTR